MEEVIKVDDCVGNIGDYDIPIHNAIIVPEGTTNGDIIKAIFPNAEIKEIMGSFDNDKLLGYRTLLGGRSQDYFLDWWNESYDTESKIKLSEQQSNNDCISKNAVLEIFGYVMDYWKEHAIDIEPHEIKDTLIEQYEFTAKQLSDLPPVTPQQKIGQWIKHDTGHSIYYDCSLCSCVAPCTETADSFIWKLSNYCPDCGAKMGVEK